MRAISYMKETVGNIDNGNIISARESFSLSYIESRATYHLLHHNNLELHAYTWGLFFLLEQIYGITSLLFFPLLYYSTACNNVVRSSIGDL
jgi:hypothetical protein